MPETKMVRDDRRIGKKGYPRHYEALGIDPPMREVALEDDEREEEGSDEERRG